jgi:hypothetical protein
MIKVSKSVAVCMSMFAVLILMTVWGVNECKAQEISVYRFYNDQLKTHFYTTDENEKTELQADAAINGWVYEGQAWNAYATNVAGTLPIYRFYSNDSGTHLYTMDENEKNVLAQGSVWQYEGVAYYAYPAPSGCTIPVYRLYSDGLKRHLYTTDANEASILSNGPVWVGEGISWHAAIKRCGPDIVMSVPTGTDKITLAWLPFNNTTTSSADMTYEVHLSTETDFEPAPNTKKAVSRGIAQADISGLATGTTYYALIVAIDNQGDKTRSGKYYTATTFTNPIIVSDSTKFYTDKNLGLENAIRDDTTYTYQNNAGATQNKTAATPPEAGSVLFINVGEDIYMRKVVSTDVTASDIIVHTGDAELSEVLNQATVNNKFTLFNVHDASEWSDITESRVTLSDGSRKSQMHWQNNLLVAEQTDHVGETSDIKLTPGEKNGHHRISIKTGYESSAELNASVSFTPEIESDFSWSYSLLGGIKIENARVVARGTLSATIDATYNFSASASVDKEIPFPFFTRTYRSVYLLGGVPVYQRIIFTLDGGFKASAESEINANANANASASVEFGAAYGTGGWNYIAPSPTFSKSVTADISVMGSVHGEVRLIPNIRVEFYRIVAGDLSVEPIIGSDIRAELMDNPVALAASGYLPAQLTQFDINFKAEAFVGISAGIFSRKIAILGKTKIFETPSWLLFSLPKLEPPTVCDTKVGCPVSYSADVKDGTNNAFDDASIQWKIYPEEGGSLSQGSRITTFTPQEEGTYTLFFSGHSLLGEPFGRQFVQLPVTVLPDDGDNCDDTSCEIVMHHDCPLLQEAGGDNPETHIVEMFQSSGKFNVGWQTYTIKDRITVEYEGQVIMDTGCVGEYNSTLLEIDGESTEITVKIYPNCAGETNTAWEIEVDCPIEE